MDDDWRNREINLQKEYAWLVRVTRGVVLIGFGILIGLIIYADPASRQSYAINVFTSILGLGATALIFDELNRKRSKDELKQQLIIDAASTSNSIAVNAVHQLWRRDWLQEKDGLLKGADLTSANLQDAVLIAANLEGADLRTANLKGANLFETNLRGAKLIGANLQSAVLTRANLQGAYLQQTKMQYGNLYQVDMRWANLTDANLRQTLLMGANLQKSDLKNANLRKADLRGANLKGANLRGANLLEAQVMGHEFDGTTIMPDGNLWSSETDMEQFTTERPGFFESIWLMLGKDQD